MSMRPAVLMCLSDQILNDIVSDDVNRGHKVDVVCMIDEL